MNSASQSDMPKAYDPRQSEPKWYQFWLEGDYFQPRIDRGKEPFTIIMPPPNVTGELHLGHALVSTLEDIFTRWHRMKGDPTLWLPGVDHAAIAVQNVVEQELAKEGKTRHDLGREKFLERVWEWIHQYRPIITEQHQKLGVSCDWSRERFTMDEGPSRAVRSTFINLYHKGLIYRGHRITNWCPRCATALSDLEVEHQERESHLWYVKYRLADADGNTSRDESITVATTRPETILGDTAVAVNPEDERFSKLIGRKAILPALGRAIPIIADDVVDQAFGTGAVKVTPAHDPVDFDISQRHGLPEINILNPDATMNHEAGLYEGLDRFACREALIADLEKEGLLIKVEPYRHSVGHCQRCDTPAEPWLSEQWFVRIAPLANPAIDAVVNGDIKIIPERFTKEYLNWMENIRDWCISRQLWWGHRIPVWHCPDCSADTVPGKESPMEDPVACGECGSTAIAQDEDVLDTWFSSGLWPHSTLGWPDDSEDLGYFYPTAVMETAYDILFFWVARMIMLGIENTGQVPFRTVYLHGLVRDAQGRKMSKSLGNVINPLEVIEQYGTDALRHALITGNTPGNDMKLTDEKLEAGRNFANKLWNATRFVISNLANAEPGAALGLDPSKLELEDRWILSRLNRLIDEVAQLLEAYQLGEACRRIHDFLWGEYCDWYVEMSKIRIRQEEASSPLPVLVHVLETGLRLLHPYMPFVTEELWQRLKEASGAEWAEALIVAPYPKADLSWLDEDTEAKVEAIIELIRAIRNARAEYHVEPSRWVEAIISSRELHPVLVEKEQAISTLARARPIHLQAELAEKPQQALALLMDNVEAYLPLAGMVDLETERQRLDKEAEECQREIGRLEGKLSNEQFLTKAPVEVVEREREKLAGHKDRIARLEERLAAMT
jgi:valyl-tRNA synthetase